MSSNISGEIAHLRDTFLKAEREYVEELIKNDNIVELISEISEYSSEILFEKAKNIMEQVENGMIAYEEMERVEQELIVILAAIQDKVLKKDLSLVPISEMSLSRR